MLFRKYHIVIFKENGSEHRNIFMRGWFGITIFLLIIALALGNLFFFTYFGKSKILESKLKNNEKIIEDQNNQMLNLVSKFRNIQTDLTRIQQFDTKLRIMMNLENEFNDNIPADGLTFQTDPTFNSFSQNYLPLHRQELLARKMHNFLKDLDINTSLEEVVQQELIIILRDNKETLIATPSIWPADGWVSSPFGRRNSPFTGRNDFHKGLDITAKTGTPVIAPAKGIVSFTGRDYHYGISILINHGNGITTRYAHLQKALTKEGQIVSRGDKIGQIGSTGRTTGPHLHYEIIFNGLCVNPMRYILN